MKVTYIAHSGFFVELEERCILFDYWKGDVPAIDKPLTVFVSHGHADHFGEDTFRVGERRPGTRYVLSADIRADRERLERMGARGKILSRCLFAEPEQTYELDGLRFRTLRSTDLGTAYLLRCGGRSLYHAGDLHLWLWGAEDTPEEEAAMRAAFAREMEMLRGERVDAAFLPLDPRLDEEHYALGLDEYAAALRAEHIFPMHCWGQYDVIERAAARPSAAPYADRLVRITGEGQTFTI